MERGGWERRGPVRRSRNRFPLLALTLAIPVLGLLVFLGFRFSGRFQFETATTSPRKPGKVSKASSITPRARRSSAPSPGSKSATTKRIVLIIDDLGYSQKHLEAFTALPAKLSFSVIPGTPHGRNSAEMLGRRGFEVLCHLPMEPVGYAASAKTDGMILTSMSPTEVREQTRRHLRSIPYARGVNNHMGSRATTDPAVMSAVMSVLKEEKAYFVDSLTTPASVGMEEARKKGVRVASRKVFLDHEVNEAQIRRQLDSLADIAEKEGIAIGIAHQHSETIRVLQREIPRLRARGFRFVSAAEAVN